MRFLNFFLLALLVILQIHLWFGDGSVSHILVLQKKVDAQKAVNKDLSDRNELLGAEVLDLQHGTDAIEEYARTELGMVKPGETFLLVVNPKRP